MFTTAHRLIHQIPKSMQRARSSAPITTNIKLDPNTGELKISPENQTVHKAPDVYGELAPGGPDLETSEEHAKQKIKDANEEEEMAEASRREDEEEKRAMTAEEGRKHGFWESQKRVQEARQAEASAIVAEDASTHVEGRVRTEDKNVLRGVEGESDSEESGGELESSNFGPKLPGIYESDD